ncbi:MAG: FHA domain-containing protein [Bacteriovoracaceae bacterium]
MSISINIYVNGKCHNVRLNSKPLVLGRASSCNVKFSDGLLSSKHCEIYLDDDGKVVITDLNSTNGTYVNGIKVVSSHLYIGEVLTLGTIKIEIDKKSLTRSERALLTRKSQLAKTKFLDLKVDAPQKSPVVKDLSSDGDDEATKETKLVSLEARKKLKPSKKIKKPKKDEGTDGKDVLTKVVNLFKKNG